MWTTGWTTGVNSLTSNIHSRCHTTSGAPYIVTSGYLGLFFLGWVKRTKTSTGLHIVPMFKNVCCVRCHEVVLKHEYSFVLGVLTQTSKVPKSCNQSLPWVLLRLSYAIYHYTDSSPATRIQFISLMLGSRYLRESGSFALQ
jgi:hypothetical protein